MATKANARPVISVYSCDNENEVVTQIALPGVFTAPIRPDVVQFVHTNMNKNKIQAHGVSRRAGHQTSAESWGTGRAVSRIPRVQGGGTQRSGQGAFGNMCRSGRMFSPIRIWRKWHRKINVNQRRYAVASALAASSVPALVMARGHRIEKLVEVPLVIDNGVETLQKTSQAVKVLERFGIADDLERCSSSKKVRAGKGKMRNRRYVMRRGPLIVFDQGNGIQQAFRNIPGVDMCQVDRLNLLQLAPGGHVGRLIIWTRAAFEKLDTIFGTYSKKSAVKTGYSLPQHIMSNANLGRIINSEEIQSVLRAQKTPAPRRAIKRNPLKNFDVMVKLNPYAEVLRNAEIKLAADRKDKKKELLAAKRNIKNTSNDSARLATVSYNI